MNNIIPINEKIKILKDYNKENIFLSFNKIKHKQIDQYKQSKQNSFFYDKFINEKQEKELLTNSYIVKRLKIKESQCSQELIILKRQQIIIQRLTEEIQNECFKKTK
jgi:hypothetical protein